MIWVIGVVFIIIIAFALLPLVVKNRLNAALRKMNGYTGSIDQLDIQFFKRKIIFRNLTIHSFGDKQDYPLLQVPTIFIFFKWKSLVKKLIELDIMLDKPQLHIVAEEPTSIDHDDSKTAHELPNLKNSIENLLPLKINIDVSEGEIRYINSHSKPGWNVVIHNLNVKMRDFSNRSALSEVCHIESRFHLHEGTVALNVMLRPLEPNLSLDMNLELTSLNMVLLNDVFRTYGKVDINTGTMDLFAEVAIAENVYKGYVKPVIRDLDFISKADRTDTLIQKVWERIVAGLFTILANTRNDQIATIVPIEGRLDDPHVRVVAAIIGILRNAFIKALTPSLENIININSIWNKKRTTL